MCIWNVNYMFMVFKLSVDRRPIEVWNQEKEKEQALVATLWKRGYAQVTSPSQSTWVV